MRALKRSAVLEVALFAYERASRLVLKAESYRPTERITVGSNIAQTAVILSLKINGIDLCRSRADCTPMVLVTGQITSENS
jgi:hypothetical protein